MQNILYVNLNNPLMMSVDLNEKNSYENKKIAFVLYSNVLWGSGLEKTALFYILYKPDNIKNVVLVHTKPLPNQKNRIKESVLELIKNKSQLIEINNDYVKMEDVVTKFPKIIRYVIYYPSIFIMKYISYSNLYNKIGKPDIIYLFRNDFSYFLGQCNFLIGSTHGWYPSNSRLQNKINKITSIIFRNKIKVYHTFPVWSEKVKKMYPNKKIIEVPNGIDTNLFKPILKTNNKIRFLFVARLEKCKGILTVLKIWEKFKDYDRLELKIVGSGTLENEVREIIKNYKNAEYLGILNEENLAKVYGESDFFIYPSICDSLPLVILEALSSGCHVITTNRFRGFFKEFESIGAITFCNNTPEDFSLEINNLIKNFDYINTNKEKNHKVASENYDIKLIVKKLYSSIINEYNKS